MSYFGVPVSISVAGLITDAGVTLVVEGYIRRRLIYNQLDGSPRLTRVSRRLLADLDGARSQLEGHVRLMHTMAR